MRWKYKISTFNLKKTLIKVWFGCRIASGKYNLLRKELKMANVIRIFMAAVCVSVIFGGCSNKQEKDLNKIPLSSQETEKRALRRKLEAKYSDAESHYQMGKLYQADGLWDRAENSFTLATGFDPANWKAEAAKVKVILQRDEKQRSALSAENAMNRARVSAEASLLLGKAFQKEELDEYAVACYNQALTMAPNSAALHKQVGYYYLSKNDKARAEEYLRRSFQLNPYQPEVAGELGRMGVIVEIPRKTQKNTRGLDKLLESDDK